MGTQTSNEPTTAPGTPARKSRKAWWVIVGVAAVVALVVLAGGALVSGVLATSGRGGLFNRPEGERPNFQIVPAAELPASAPNVRGVVTQRADKAISVVERGGFGANGGANQSQGNNAPQVEVVVTNDTVIYHDITRANLNEGAPSGTIQQKLEAGSLDGINADSRITVWGDQNGQQLTAKVLVYSDPIAFRQP
jgi:hypothetical protein